MRPGRQARHRAALTLVLLVGTSGLALAQTGARRTQATVVQDTSPGLRIEIEMPAQRLEAGRDLSFVARLTNDSDTEVRMRGTSLTLTVPLALDPMRWSVAWHAFFPTLPKDQDEYVLQPGNTTRVFWTINRNQQASGDQPTTFEWITGSLAELVNPKTLFFQPGDYSVAVTARYWTMPGDESLYRSTTSAASLPVAAPMAVVLFGAGLGGVISFMLMPKMKLRDSWEWHKWTVRSVLSSMWGAFGTALLSVIVTILLSRISNTEFFIQVSVNDLWGAVAVGFLSPLVAGSVIQRFTGDQSGTDKTKKQEPTPHDRVPADRLPHDHVPERKVLPEEKSPFETV